MDKVLIEATDSIIKLTLNEPESLNAIGEQMANELRAAVRLAADPAQKFRCLVLTGAGRGFCSGGSVSFMDERRQSADDRGDIEDRITLGTHHHYILKKLKALPYPVITAVNGPAAGLGFSYALAGDMIVAARSAFFVAAFRNIGVSPDGGLSWMLPRIIGWARARELMLIGNRLPAESALQWGLVNRIYDDDSFMDETMKLAHELANGPTVALAQIRRLAWESWDHTYEQHLDQEERLQPITFATADAVGGGRAMLEKRQPRFSGN